MRQPCGGHRKRQRYPDMLVAEKRLAAEFDARIEHLPQQFAGMLAKAFALWRKLRRVDAAVDQVEAKPGLQRFDPAAERRLRRVSFLGSAGEIAGFGNHQEILKPAKLHHTSRFGAGRSRGAPAVPALGQHKAANANRRRLLVRNVSPHARKRSGSECALTNASFASRQLAASSGAIPINPRLAI
jgi:hypothetical protein